MSQYEEVLNISNSYKNVPVQDTDTLEALPLIKRIAGDSVKSYICKQSAKLFDAAAKRYYTVSLAVDEAITTGGVMAYMPLLETIGGVVGAMGVAVEIVDYTMPFWVRVSNAVLTPLGFPEVDYDEIKDMQILTTIWGQLTDDGEVLHIAVPESVIICISDYIEQSQIVTYAPGPVGSYQTVYGASYYNVANTLTRVRANASNKYASIRSRYMGYVALHTADIPAEEVIRLDEALEQYKSQINADWGRDQTTSTELSYADFGKTIRFVGGDFVAYSQTLPVQTTDTKVWKPNEIQTVGVDEYAVKTSVTKHIVIDLYLYNNGNTAFSINMVNSSTSFVLDNRYSTYVDYGGAGIPVGTQVYPYDYSQPFYTNRPALHDYALKTGDGDELTVPILYTPGDSIPAYNPENTLPGFPEETAVRNLVEQPEEPEVPGIPHKLPTPPIDGGTLQPPFFTDNATMLGFFTVWNPTGIEVGELAQAMWSTSFIEQLKKVFGDPINGIIALHKIYCQPTITPAKHNIQIGYIETGVQSYRVTEQYIKVDCGYIDIPEYYESVYDYEYTQLQLYLPFISIVDIDIHKVMGKRLHVWYTVDVLTGTCTASVAVQEGVLDKTLYTFNGNCSVSIPITSGSFNNMLVGLLQVTGSIATGNILGAASTAAGGGLAQNVSMSGNFSSNAGAMLPRKPYLLISRRVPVDFTRTPDTDGHDSNVFVNDLQAYADSLGTGLHRVAVDNIKFSTAIPVEHLAELRQLLRNGIVL